MAFGPQIGAAAALSSGPKVSQCLLSDPQQQHDGDHEYSSEDPQLLLCRSTCPDSAAIVHDLLSASVNVACPAGIEPATHSLEGCCSIL